MLIQSNLFSKGFMTGQASLSDVLTAHEQRLLAKINRVSSLDELSDAFLNRLVADSLIEPVVLHDDQMTRQLRTEEFDGEELPFDFVGARRGKKYPKQVARITIPFSGDSQLLTFTPSSCGTTFPQGQVSGKTIQFDVILWGREDDAHRVKEQLDENLRLLKRNARLVDQDVKIFNEALTEKVKKAFESKLAELAKQHSIFDDLGIKEHETITSISATDKAHPQPKKANPCIVHIVQHIANQYVHTLNQFNKNTGDVNNAIQSD